MKWLASWRERARWRRGLRDVPLDQLREMVKRSAFHATPGKQQWAEQWLWRREHLYNNPIPFAGLAIGALAMIAAYLKLLWN